jgi:hypothetical protein
MDHRQDDALQQAGAAPADDPHRKTRRYAHREPVQFRKPLAMTALTVDIGAGGVGVEAPHPIAPGTPVELEIFDGHPIVLGTVRWSRQEQDRYRLGIQFNDEDWSIIARVQALREKGG